LPIDITVAHIAHASTGARSRYWHRCVNEPTAAANNNKIETKVTDRQTTAVVVQHKLDSASVFVVAVAVVQLFGLEINRRRKRKKKKQSANQPRMHLEGAL